MGLNPIEAFFSNLANKFKKDHPHFANAPLQLETISVLLQEAVGHLDQEDLTAVLNFVNAAALKGKLSPGQVSALSAALLQFGRLISGLAADFHKKEKSK